jgi:hypothetical protein
MIQLQQKIVAARQAPIVTSGQLLVRVDGPLVLEIVTGIAGQFNGIDMINHKNVRLQKILMVLLGWLILPAICLANGQTEIQARQVAEIFLKAEFEGNSFNKRVELIKFSPKREEKEIKKKSPLKPHVFNWDWDPLYVVTSYQILNTKINNGSFVVTVVYTRVASRSKPGGKITSDYKERDIVKLSIKQVGDKWWVIDPPLPKMSQEGIIKCYEDDLKTFDDKWFGGASEEQKQVSYKKQEDLKILKGLPGKQLRQLRHYDPNRHPQPAEHVHRKGMG